MPEPLFKALDVVPRHAYPFLWADYVELLCLCSRNGTVSKGNLQAQSQEALDVQADADDDGSTDEASAELDDRVAAKWCDIQGRLQVRAASWQTYWPFALSGAVLRSKFDSAKAEHRLYVALLVASSLRLCSATRSGEVTSAFEEISYHWLRRSLNPLWEVRPFAAHQTLSGAYTGSLGAKMQSLAADISAVLIKPADSYDPGNSGDAGIDLVAWQRLGDRRGNLPVIFGQCACSPTDWESKQLDVTPTATEAYLLPQHPAAAYCFVPHDLSLSDTAWQRTTHVKRTVLIDRLRILNMFESTQDWASLPTWPFVGEPAAMGAAMAT